MPRSCDMSRAPQGSLRFVPNRCISKLDKIVTSGEYFHHFELCKWKKNPSMRTPGAAFRCLKAAPTVCANTLERPMFGNTIFRQLFDAASSTYTYVVGDPQSLEAVVIDTVFEQHFRDCALVEELGLKLVAALDTHCHADHVTGAWLMQQATGCRIGMSKRCAALQGANLRFDHGDRVAFGERVLE